MSYNFHGYMIYNDIVYVENPKDREYIILYKGGVTGDSRRGVDISEVIELLINLLESIYVGW